MRTLAIVCFCLCLIAAITPASAELLTPTSYSLCAPYASVVGHPVADVFDVDLNTYLQTTTNNGCIEVNYASGTNVTECRIYPVFHQTYYSIESSITQGAGYAYKAPTTIAPWTWGNFTIASGNLTGGKFYLHASTGGWPMELSHLECHGTFTPAPLVADFNATPLSGQAPLYVALQDNSTGGITPYTHNWSVDPTTGVIGAESTSEYPTIVFTQNGNYTITHCVDDGSSSDCEEKTDYIWTYNSTALATTTFWAVDPLGHRVWDSAISLQDVQNSSWTNASSPSGGSATITSLFGHTINGYATAAGYNDGETLGITADGVSGGIILMTPTNITNVSAGYVTLYVYVKESVGNAPISGAYVNLAYAEGGSTRNDGGTTSTEGVASFVVPNNTLIYVYGEKAGYERVSTTKDSGSASGGSASVSVILYMGSQIVTPTVTATTGPGGTVPVTVDPRTPQEKESDIALILIDYGDMLVMFFIALTIIGGVKMIIK